MAHISRDSFRVDLLTPFLQTTTSYMTMQMLGRMGQYTVRPQTVVLVSGMASLISSFVGNFFNKAYVYYASLPLGIGAGLAAHHFFYSSIPYAQILDAKGALILTAVLAAIKIIENNLPTIEEESEEVIEEVAKLQKQVIDQTNQTKHLLEEKKLNAEEKVLETAEQAIRGKETNIKEQQEEIKKVI